MGLYKGYKLKEVTRSERVTIRLTEEELTKLDRIAATLGMTRTGALMAGVDKLQEKIERRQANE